MQARAAVARGKRRVENAAEWKQRVLGAFTRLQDRSAQGSAMEELTADIEELDASTTLPQFMEMLLHTCVERKAAQCREAFKLVGITAKAHGNELLPYVPKIMAAVVRALKEPEIGTIARETISEAVGIVAQSVPPVVVPGSESTGHVLGMYMKPLFVLLAEQDKNFQIGAAMCITSVISNSKIEHVIADMPRFVRRIIDRMIKPVTQSHGSLLLVIYRLVEIVGEDFIQFVPQVLPQALNCLELPDWQTKKIASDFLFILAMRLGQAMTTFKNQILKALTDHKYEKVAPVRDSVAAALRAYADLGYAASPAAAAVSTLDSSKSRAIVAGRQQAQRPPRPSVASTFAARGATAGRFATASRIASMRLNDDSALPSRGPSSSASGHRHTRSEFVVGSNSSAWVGGESPLMEEPTADGEGEVDMDYLASAAGAPPTAGVKTVWDKNPAHSVDFAEDEQSVEAQLAERRENGSPDQRQIGGVAFTVDITPPSAYKAARGVTQNAPASAPMPESSASIPEPTLRTPTADLVAALAGRVAALEKSQSDMVAMLRERDAAIATLTKTVRYLEQQFSKMKPTSAAQSPAVSLYGKPLEPPSAEASVFDNGVTPRSALDQAFSLAHAGNLEAAYRRILATNDPLMVYRLMDFTGPVLENLEEETREELFRQMTPHILDGAQASLIFPWIEQMIDMPPLPQSHIRSIVSVLEQVMAMPTDQGITAARLVSAIREKYRGTL